MMPVANAIAVASDWLPDPKMDPREHLHYVKVEPSRVWAANGHSAIFLDVEAKPDEVGYYHLGKTKTELPANVRIPPIDNLIPPKGEGFFTKMGVLWLRQLAVVCKVIPRATMILRWSGGDDPAVLEVAEVLSEKDQRKRSARHFEIPTTGSTSNVKGGVNPRYLLRAVQSLGCLDLDQDGKDDRTFDLYREGDSYNPFRVDGPRGFAIIMPVRV